MFLLEIDIFEQINEDVKDRIFDNMKIETFLRLRDCIKC